AAGEHELRGGAGAAGAEGRGGAGETDDSLTEEGGAQVDHPILDANDAGEAALAVGEQQATGTGLGQVQQPGAGAVADLTGEGLVVVEVEGGGGGGGAAVVDAGGAVGVGADFANDLAVTIQL